MLPRLQGPDEGHDWTDANAFAARMTAVSAGIPWNTQTCECPRSQPIFTFQSPTPFGTRFPPIST